MRREIFAPSPLSVLRSGLVPILFTLLVIAMIIYGLDRTEKSGRSEATRILEEGLRRAAVTCYAVEGRYPDSVAYMEEHYGVYVDQSKYTVHYEIFASNILPDITVIELT